MRRHRPLPNELFLPSFDVPVVAQVKIEEGRKMNPSSINVGPFVVIRSKPNPMFPKYRMRTVICRRCPSMNDPQPHWHKECTTFPNALTVAGDHLNACHSNGSSNEA